jgi:hypothetical protein
MRKSVTLFHLEREDIKIHIQASFDGEKLTVDGYDIGKTVEEAWGDSDYEYDMVIPAEGVDALYGLLNVRAGDKKGLLKALAERFHGNRCFSEIGDFLDEHGIAHGTSRWM